MRKPLEEVIENEGLSAPKPFLRWAGGKRKLTKLLINAIPQEFNPKLNRFFEPFVGGGAMMLALGNPNIPEYVKGKNLFINDMNPDLITTYKIIRDDVDELIEHLKTLAFNISKEHFEEVRAQRPISKVEIAARFIYLNKTCFNGLWRVNSNGEFNVPWGKLLKPLIFEEQNLRIVSKRLKYSKITNKNFDEATQNVKEGDLIYFDPPYIPLSSSSSFSQYAKANFDLKNHRELAQMIRILTKRRALIMMSNSDTQLTREIFGPLLNLHQISMSRSISASSDSRKPVYELIGTNFPVRQTSLLSSLKKIS